MHVINTAAAGVISIPTGIQWILSVPFVALEALWHDPTQAIASFPITASAMAPTCFLAAGWWDE
eukprot:15457388-Alexandrium_andersonii.AAC.1